MQNSGVRAVAAAVLFASVMGAGPQAASVRQRSAALTALFKEMWEDRLKHSPEFASALGDRRYNDQVSRRVAAGGCGRSGARPGVSAAA